MAVKRISDDFGFAAFVQLTQDFIVFFQAIVGISDQVFTFDINLVIIGVTTIIAAKLFITSSLNSFPAF